MKNFLIAYLALVAGTSLVAFAMYGIDKWQAKRQGWRISEKSLHVIALLGGWPGAIAGQRFFRHKTQKTSFRIVFWLVVTCHLIVVAALAYTRIA